MYLFSHINVIFISLIKFYSRQLDSIFNIIKQVFDTKKIRSRCTEKLRKFNETLWENRNIYTTLVFFKFIIFFIFNSKKDNHRKISIYFKCTLTKLEFITKTC